MEIVIFLKDLKAVGIAEGIVVGELLVGYDDGIGSVDPYLLECRLIKDLVDELLGIQR
ncbi:MAG: hypothetical protein II712_05185 [Erysipelotrichaceae bacterium]|nr:hypothetical protein [Erysipelotrichaceae bacterium]